MPAPPSHYFGLLKLLVEGRDVLDIGSINHALENGGVGREWMFPFLVAHARRVQGIDISAAEVAKARALGHDIIQADAETYRSDRGWDVVMAGDVIEHLSNPGRFLDCARANLREGGILVISTPNTYCLRELARVVAGFTNDPPVNPEHTCTFTPKTLRALCARHGFRQVSLDYTNIPYGPRKRRLIRLLLALNAAATAPLPRFRQTMVAVFRRD